MSKDKVCGVFPRHVPSGPAHPRPRSGSRRTSRSYPPDGNHRCVRGVPLRRASPVRRTPARSRGIPDGHRTLRSGLRASDGKDAGLGSITVLSGPPHRSVRARGAPSCSSVQPGSWDPSVSRVYRCRGLGRVVGVPERKEGPETGPLRFYWGTTSFHPSPRCLSEPPLDEHAVDTRCRPW